MEKLKKAISVIMAVVCLGALSGCSSSGNNLPMEERQFYLPHSSKSKLTDSKDDIVKQEGLKVQKDSTGNPVYATSKKVEVNGVLFEFEADFNDDDSLKSISYMSDLEEGLNSLDEEYEDMKEYFNTVYGESSDYEETNDGYNYDKKLKWNFYNEDNKECTLYYTYSTFDAEEFGSENIKSTGYLSIYMIMPLIW